MFTSIFTALGGILASTYIFPSSSYSSVHLLKAALCSVRPSRAFLSLDHKPFGCLTLPRPQMHFSKSQSFRKQSWSRYPSRTENIPHLIFRVQKCQGFAESSIIDVPSAGEGVCILKPTIPFFCLPVKAAREYIFNLPGLG